MMQVDKTITAGKSTQALKPRTTSYLNRDRRETYMDVLSILMSYRIAKRLNLIIMSTVKKIIELLSSYPEDFQLLDEQNRPFIHIVNANDNTVRLSANKPIGLCDRSGGYVYPSVVDGYDGFSPELDEDLYNSEFTCI